MKVLVCGGRDYQNLLEITEVLDRLHEERKFTLLISGSADGADFLALLWARSRQVRVETFPAKWKEHGNAAGPIRNQKMLDEGKPDLVVAFPGGAGTADMKRRAKAAKIETIEI